MDTPAYYASTCTQLTLSLLYHTAVSSLLVLLHTTARFSAFRATFFRGLARSAVAGPLPVLALGLLASALYRAHDTAAAQQQQQQQEWSSERLIACAVLAAVAVLLGLYLPSMLRIQRQTARARRRRQQQQQRLRQRQHQHQQRKEQQQQQHSSSGNARDANARSSSSFREAFAAALRQDSTSRSKQQQQLKTWPSSAATAGALQQLQNGGKAATTAAGAAAGATTAAAAVPSGWEAFDRARRLDPDGSLRKQQLQRGGTQVASITAASARSGTAATTAARQQWQPQLLPSLSEVLYSAVAVALLVLCGEGVSSDRRGSGRLLGPAAAAAAVVLALPLSQVSLQCCLSESTL
jgi:hypothetical protein